MSAIAGLWRFDQKPDPASDCARMLGAQEIYGPHDGRQWSDGTLALGRRLFRLLPEDANDRQPLHSADGRLVLVADVRLDNRDELMPDLQLGTPAPTRLCDAAILLAALERWGEAALDRLAGDFAFALWDSKAQKLTLARDFLGQRPLHFHRSRNFFAFSSMAKGLHALDEIPYAPDEQMVAEAVVLMPQWGPRSFFKHIDRVEPAHIVTVTRDSTVSRRYWEPKRSKFEPGNAETYAEGLRHHLDQATRSMLRGVTNVVGAQLSAGFDSGAVTTTAAKLLLPSGAKVVAFTAVPRVGYDGPVPRNQFGDEGPLAAASAAMFPNIEHVLIRAADASPLDSLDRMFFLFERPVIVMGNMGWWLAINQAARARKLNIMLTGQTGNMTVSYNGLELLPELLRQGRLIALCREASRLMAHTGMTWRGALVRSLGPFSPIWLWRWLNERIIDRPRNIHAYSAIRADRLAALNLPALARERDLEFSYRPRKDGFAMRQWVLSRGDNGNGNKGTLAGWGLDQRDPTADKRLVEYCLSIPTEHYLADGVPRALAKRALADRLPQAVLNEQKKGYQAADWHESLTAAREDMRTELARLDTCSTAAQLLDLERLKSLVDNWPTSGWERDDVREAYRLALLRGVAAGHFLRKASGANR